MVRTVLLSLHIVFGTIGLIVGPAAMLVRKRRGWHTRLGLTYQAVVAGLSHPMGPLRLSDLVGLDTLKLIADKMYEEFKEPHYGAPPLLLRMVEAGMLGKKSGRGFYTY